MSVVAPGSPSQGREEHRPAQTRQGVGANSRVNSIRQAPDPRGSGELPAAVTLLGDEREASTAALPRKHCGDAPDS